MTVAEAAVRTFQPGDSEGIRDVLVASLRQDDIPGFTMADIERTIVRMTPDPGGTVVAFEGDLVVGVCTPRADALTVHPDARRRGHGRRLALAAREVVRDRGLDGLQLHVPEHLPASVAFATALGMAYRSSLWQFELAAARAAAVPEPTFPDDVVARRWDDTIDTDFVAWTAFMNASFEGHPSPISWSAAVVEHVHDQPSFDAEGICIVHPRGRPTQPVAFTRTERDRDESGVLVGEIGLIGVLPAWRGRGLGRALLRWGVTDLLARGATDRIVLAVEAENDRATALYRAHGFEPVIEWPHWVLPLD